MILEIDDWVEKLADILEFADQFDIMFTKGRICFDTKGKMFRQR